jgi:hypothetical protein
VSLTALQTPCLVLDPMRPERNLGRMSGRARELGVAFRPHLKTAKSRSLRVRRPANLEASPSQHFMRRSISSLADMPICFMRWVSRLENCRARLLLFATVRD